MSTNTPDTQPGRDHLLNDQQYFLLNALAVIILPAVGTLYFALAQIWGLPSAEEVVGTIVAVDTFLGILVKVGETSYNNSESRFAGAINVAEQPDKTVYSLDLNHPVEELTNKDQVTFRVNTPKVPPRPAAQIPLGQSAPPAPSQ